MPVVIVESPAKAKTINKYLGSNYEVLASYGHVRDLPAKDGSVEPEHDFTMQWEVDGKRTRRTMGFASLGGATLDNEENYLIKKLFTALGAIQIENQARI